MLKLTKVAITGGLSCGKSSVCRILRGLGAYVISADDVVHQLLSSDTKLIQEVVRLLGSDVCVNQQLDRSRMARLVFQDSVLLQTLEQLLHPLVYRELDRNYQQQCQLIAPPPLFIAEIPLLFESGGQRGYDATVAVIADEEICRERFKGTTHLDGPTFDRRSARQLSVMQKAALADYVIVNNGSLSDLQKAAQELYQQLLSHMSRTGGPNRSRSLDAHV